MKKLMLVFGLMAIVFISRASENTEPVKVKDQKENQAVKTENKSDAVNTEFKLCTVTQTAKVSVYIFDYTVSCSATAENCAAAIDQSLACVVAAVEKLKKAVM